ncbi:MAG: ammonium transporter [Deltaproteobacteria bacterium]|jgi:Amt family ammonium transporter|nr:ammonium transporter [Deltaproteobacteria bacterium]
MKLLVTMFIILLIPTPVLAEETLELLPQSAGNTMWTMIGAMLVMFMQPGFSLVECGLTRAKNAAAILMKNFADFSIGSIVYLLLGFGLMFGHSLEGLIGGSGFLLSGVDGSGPDGQWTLTFWFFQSVFCATAATIVSGGVAERIKFSSYLLSSALVSAFIYPISGHWAWNSLISDSKGWLEALGFVDFAGSTVVHSVGGWITLAGAIVIGPRLGKYTLDGKARAIPGHNLPLAALGVFILWFAWFGFNCGSTTTADGTLGFIAVNTNLSACAGFLGAMLVTWLKNGKPEPSMSFNGVLAGLVGITAGCFEVSPCGAIIIGLSSGILVTFAVLFIDQTLKVDDPVGAISVHGVCGAWGTLMVGLFASPGYGDPETLGLFYGGGAGLLGVQAIGVLAVGAWAFAGGLAVFKLVKALTGLRVSREEELKGLDITGHGSEAYSGFQIFTVD